LGESIGVGYFVRQTDSIEQNCRKGVDAAEVIDKFARFDVVGRGGRK
jgi:hypothetical protein